MENNKNIKPFIALFAIILLGSVAIFALINYFDISRQELEYKTVAEKNATIDNCLKAGQITSKDGNVTRTETIMNVYELCMKDKGYSIY